MLYYLNDSIEVNKFTQQAGRSLDITGNRRGYNIAQIHIESVCEHCGNVAYAMPYYSSAEGKFIWGANNDICTRCRDVLNDYHFIDDYDEFDDDDEWGVCPYCGGEYGDGWTTCVCYDHLEEWDDDELYPDDDEEEE